MDGAGHTGVAEAEGSWDLTKSSVSSIGAMKPPTSTMGSKIVKTKRGTAGRIDAMAVTISCKLGGSD